MCPIALYPRAGVYAYSRRFATEAPFLEAIHYGELQVVRSGSIVNAVSIILDKDFIAESERDREREREGEKQRGETTTLSARF